MLGYRVLRFKPRYLIYLYAISFTIFYFVQRYLQLYGKIDFDELLLYRHLPNSSKPIIYAPVYEEAINNQTYSTPHVVSYTYDYWIDSRVYKGMSRAVTINQHKQMMHILEHVDKLLRLNNITYMMIDGSLIGSFRNHDVVPWDDDLVNKTNN